MKPDHRGFAVHQARKLGRKKRQKNPEKDHVIGPLTRALRKQINRLQEENFNLQNVLKLQTTKKIQVIEENTAKTNAEKLHTERENRNEKLTQANARLVVSAVELQVAVDKIKIAKAEMTHLANYDFLTDLPNRMQLFEKINLGIDWAKRHHAKMALLFLDIDRFKQINDSLGHTVGDKLLQSIAQRLKNVVRSNDTVSRLGGDEFVLLLSEVGEINTLIPKIEEIRAVIAAPYKIEGKDLEISTSIGISLYPEDGEDSDTLILNADSAMYQAKENGRNRFYFYKEAMRKQVSSRQVVQKDISTALRNQEFELFYQAQINLRDGAISGVEAFIRWRHPVNGVLSPERFIPAAEESGAIIPIGRWVLQEACRQAQAWVKDGLDFNVIAVNISVREFDDHEFLDHVCKVLQDTGLAADRLELEITESVLMKNIQASVVTLHALRRMGIKISVDDFGTGYSSLSYLKRIPIDTMKIDQSFVSDISASNDDVLVKAMIAIGEKLHYKVIAEGVETLEQLNFLRENDCEAAQGFYLHSPMNGLDFTSVLKQNIHPDRHSAMTAQQSIISSH